MAMGTIRKILLPAAMVGLASAAMAAPAETKPGAKSGRSAPAKALFGAIAKPADLQARAIGFYARGCLAGAVALPVSGETWQVMRLSRNRNWGHPVLISMLERLAEKAPKLGWRGLLVGDLAQPRGGPMLTGHRSHQIGLDADVWLTPMPERLLSREEREEMSATNVVAGDWNDIDPKVWTPQHHTIIKAAALERGVERVLVNAAIKKALCREAKGNRNWLSTVRPFYGHNFHMHIRMRCPSDNPGCRPQDPPPRSDGCGKELAWWFTKQARTPAKKPSKPPPPMKLADLPPACRTVLTAP
jgi:penicillin-insensitive murein endopeptidase